MPPRSIAILGGGLTGLSSAFHLARKFPSSTLYLLEKQSRLGGWVQSERVQIPDSGGSFVLEGGPRTLQPRGKSVLELINLLQLNEEVITVPKSAAAAKARYLYIPPSYGLHLSGLQRLPSSIASLLVSPFTPILFYGGIRDLFIRRKRPLDALDESVDAFLARHFGKSIAHLLGSAIVHGIYAGDSRQVSLKAAFPTLFAAEERGWGSLVLGLFRSAAKQDPESYEQGDLEKAMRETSVYSFKDGMQTLTDALEDRLHSISNVNIVKGTRVLSIRSQKDQSFEITHTSGEPIHATHTVSALPPSVLHDLLIRPSESSHQSSLTHLRANPTSSVQVVNLVFPCPPVDIHPEGFGYLIPRPPSGYPKGLDASSPGILGTVFDSCSLHEQDHPPTQDYYRNARHTKLTVMVGGPYPRLPLPSALSSTTKQDIGSPPEYINRILDELKIHLGCKLPNPVYWRIWDNKDCIPTMLPGHVERMKELKEALREKWGGRLAIVSAGVGGVSVPDCIEAGRQVGRDWV